jgi:hypothetical protein
LRCESFLKADIQNADVVFCFLTPKLMTVVGELLKNARLKEGVRVVSYAFSIKGIEPEKKIKRGKGNWNIYLYKLNK